MPQTPFRPVTAALKKSGRRHDVRGDGPGKDGGRPLGAAPRVVCQLPPGRDSVKPSLANCSRTHWKRS